MTDSSPTPKPISEGGLAAALGDGVAKPAAAPQPTAPDSYSDWKAPEGETLDKAVVAEANPIFKELGLTQEQGQKLVDFYIKTNSKSLKDMGDKGVQMWNEQQQQWREQMKTDPKLSKLVGPDGNFGKDSPIVQTVDAALEQLQDPKLVTEFKQAMDITGAGNNPAFVKVFYALASKVTEGTTYASGGNPANIDPKTGQLRGRPSAAAAMYPNLKSEADARGG